MYLLNNEKLRIGEKGKYLEEAKIEIFLIF